MTEPRPAHHDEAPREAPPRTGGEPETLHPFLVRLARVRLAARALLIAHRVGVLVAASVALLLLAGGIDWVLRTPDAMRTLALLVGLFAAGWFVWRRVVPAARFAPALTDVALRLERASGDPALRGLLASAVDFARTDAHEEHQEAGLSRAMSARVVEDAARRVRTLHAGRVLRPNRPLRGLGLALGAVAGLLVVAGVAPELTRIGAQRLLTPWAGAEWPKRTQITDATTIAVHPIGRALPLRASLDKTNRPRGETSVDARYRVWIDGRAGPVRRAPMTAQQHTPPATPSGRAPEFYERLIEATLPPETERAELEYWFETEDDRTRARRVSLVQPPEVRGASARVTPPAYAHASLGAGFVQGERDLGAGRDERSVLGPVLDGSDVELILTLSRPVPLPTDEAQRAAVFGEGRGLPDGATLENEGATWTLRWRADGAASLSVRPVDADGVAAFEPARFALDAAPDRPPSAVLLEPARDEAVLATAVIDALGEARDDVGLIEAVIERTSATRTPGSEGGVEPEGAPHRAAEFVASERDTPPTRLELRTRVDLAEVRVAFTPERPDGRSLAPGDEIWLQVLARDGFERDGERHDPARSMLRRLIIIEPAELGDRLRSELAGLRRGAMRLDEQQAELQQDVASGVIGERTTERQDGLTERASAQRELVERLRERQSRNRLQDDSLADLMDRAAGALDRASDASERAREALARADASENPEAQEQSRRDARRAQEDVRDQLGRLVEMLDRGEDGWLARRSVERLLDEQRALAERTAAAGAETVGQSLDQLTPEQQAEAEAIAQEQRALARRTQEAIEDLESRAESLRGPDPAQARALAEAAQRGREQRVQERQESAAEQASQNQNASAQQLQQQAARSLEQMLEDLDRAERRREEQLRRQLAEAAERVRVLIERQQGELARLAQAAQRNVFAGLDRAMIDLHGATLAVADALRSESPDLAAPARLVERAADSQTSAILALRSDTIDAQEVERHEREALSQLEAALQEIEAQQQEADEQARRRAREELRRAYAEALREQTELREATRVYEQRELTRRERAELRALGERQLELRATLEALRERTEGLREARVFDFAHDRLASVTARAAEGLRRGESGARVAQDQRSAQELLRGLIEALREPEQEEDFGQGARQSGGGEGGGGSQDEGLVPPIAQLRLLRAMQAEALSRTRSAHRAAELGQPDAFELEDVGSLQDQLQQHGRELIEQLQQQQSPPQPVPPGGGRP